MICKLTFRNDLIFLMIKYTKIILLLKEEIYVNEKWDYFFV